MSTDRHLERWVTSTLVEGAPSREPDELLRSVLSTTRTRRPRPRWLAFLKEPPMHVSSRVAVGSPAARRMSVLTLCLVTLLLVTAAAVGAASLLPSPATLAPLPRNGLIAFGTDHDIMVADSDGTNVRTLVSEDAADTLPTWSPDGSRLAFWSQAPGSLGPTIGIVDAGGTHRRILTPPKGVDFSGTQTYGSPRSSNIEWSPDGSRLLLLGPGGTAGYGAIVDVATGTWTSPAAYGTGLPGTIWTFRWSPDGSRIAFVAYDALFVAPPGATDIGASTVDHSSTQQDGTMMTVEWSPDGRRLVYSTSPVAGAEAPIDLYTLDVESGTETHLLGGGKLIMPIWSPNGTRIAYSSVDKVGPSTGGAFHLIGSDGSDDHVLADTDINPYVLSWSPDGTRLLTMTQDPNPTARVKVVDPRGEQPPITIDAPGMSGLPSWQPVP